MYQEDWNKTQTSNLGKSKEACLQAGLTAVTRSSDVGPLTGLHQPGD